MSNDRFRRFFQSRRPNRKAYMANNQMIANNPPTLMGAKLTSSLDDNVTALKESFQHCSDIIFREMALGTEMDVRVQLVWVDGLADKNTIHDDIMKSLMHQFRLLEPNGIQGAQEISSRITYGLLSVADIKEVSDLEQVIESIMTGETAILLEGVPVCLIAGTMDHEGRSISEPATEAVVRGPRQGFTEKIRTNTSLIRRIIKSPELKMEKFTAGTKTKTDLVVAYMEGIAREDIIEEVRKRIQEIHVDSILESAYVEELIEDKPFSPFPQIAHTERPDKAAAELLEGRIVILIDGTPFVLLVPTLFIQFLQSSEDYYERYMMAFAVRIIRYLFFIIALILPSVYIALTTYHQEMLPTPLLISVAGAHEGVPFPSIIEALLMEITFEALREAGVRLPRPVGQAVSIVGALVIGEAAVTAGIVSSPMVIVVATTAIASFAIPAFNFAISVRMLRFPLMIIASVLGFYGILLGLLAMLIHLCSLTSVGVPYFTPVAPFRWNGMKDMIFRAPWWLMKTRPALISGKNIRRQNTPKPDSEDPNASDVR